MARFAGWFVHGLYGGAKRGNLRNSRWAPLKPAPTRGRLVPIRSLAQKPIELVSGMAGQASYLVCRRHSEEPFLGTVFETAQVICVSFLIRIECVTKLKVWQRY